MGLLNMWNSSNQNWTEILKQVIEKNQSIIINYEKPNEEKSERKLSNIEFNNEFENDGFYNDHIKAYCHLRNEERTFKINRIISIDIIV